MESCIRKRTAGGRNLVFCGMEKLNRRIWMGHRRLSRSGASVLCQFWHGRNGSWRGRGCRMGGTFQRWSFYSGVRKIFKEKRNTNEPETIKSKDECRYSKDEKSGKYRRDCWISSGRGDFLMRFILDTYIMDKWHRRGGSRFWQNLKSAGWHSLSMMFLCMTCLEKFLW